MEATIINLKKQKQLLEIELGDYARYKKFGEPLIHPEIYYAKIAHAWRAIAKAIKYLSTTNNDIYENFKYTEQ